MTEIIGLGSKLQELAIPISLEASLDGSKQHDIYLLSQFVPAIRDGVKSLKELDRVEIATLNRVKAEAQPAPILFHDLLTYLHIVTDMNICGLKKSNNPVKNKAVSMFIWDAIHSQLDEQYEKHWQTSPLSRSSNPRFNLNFPMTASGTIFTLNCNYQTTNGYYQGPLDLALSVEKLVENSPISDIKVPSYAKAGLKTFSALLDKQIEEFVDMIPFSE